MPKDSYPSQKRALENYKKKTRTIFFSLNLKESEQANKFENPNQIAKKLFTNYTDSNSIEEYKNKLDDLVIDFEIKEKGKNK